jgi:BirA family biotin operon repressor/biotin-[acetyl-CoA-carboxylase] ligase
VIGVGINLHPRSADGLSTAPAALQDLLPGVDAPAALAAVALPLVQAVKAFEAVGFGPFQTRFNARDALRDRAVLLSEGTEGTAHGVDDAGALLVHTALGMKQITSSEISVRPAGRHGV